MMNFFTLQYESIITISLAVVGFAVVIYAQSKINRAYNAYKKVNIKKRLSGVEVARKILDSNGLSSVYVLETPGTLSDHYNPSRKVIKLSNSVFHGETISAASVAAHECGHAIQDKEGYAMMKVRSLLAPVVGLVNYAGYFFLILSLIAGVMAYINASIILVLIALVFQLVTLPVEFNASKRAFEELKKLDLIEPKEEEGVKKMLNAAAFTYVAGILSSILQLIRLILMSQNRNRR